MDFLKNNRRFSFKLDGESIDEMNYTQKITETEDVIETVYLFECGLKVTNVEKNMLISGAMNG